MVVGGYLAVHGAQKLFGAFGGPGLDKAAAGFERIGLAPGRQMAALAGATELGGGLLTAAGIADPAGPLAIISAMIHDQPATSSQMGDASRPWALHDGNRSWGRTGRTPGRYGNARKSAHGQGRAVWTARTGGGPDGSAEDRASEHR